MCKLWIKKVKLKYGERASLWKNQKNELDQKMIQRHKLLRLRRMDQVLIVQVKILEIILI